MSKLDPSAQSPHRNQNSNYKSELYREKLFEKKILVCHVEGHNSQARRIEYFETVCTIDFWKM